MASNDNDYDDDSIIIVGSRAVQRAASSDRFRDTSIFSDQEFNPPQRPQLRNQPHGTFHTHRNSDFRHVSVPSLMNPYFTSAQQPGQPSGPNQGTFSSHQAPNMRSVSGPSTSIPNTGGPGEGFIHHRRTADWQGYGRTPATVGYEMPSMTVNRQNSGAVGFGRSRSTSFGALDNNAVSEDQDRYSELSDLDFAVCQGDFSSQIPHIPQIPFIPENDRVNSGYQHGLSSSQPEKDINRTRYRTSQSYIGRPDSCISNNNALSFNNVQIPCRERTQPQYPSNTYSVTQGSRSHVSSYPSLQQLGSQPHFVTQSSNMSSYSAGKDMDTFGTISSMSYGIQQQSSYPQLSDFPTRNAYTQQLSDGPTGLVSSDNNTYNGFDGLPSPLRQPRSTARLNPPLENPLEPAREPTVEEQDQAERDAFIQSDNDQPKQKRTRLLTTVRAKLTLRDFISEWPKGSGAFYVFPCTWCMKKGFTSAAKAWQHYSEHNVRYTGAAKKNGDKAVEVFGTLVTDITTQAEADTFHLRRTQRNDHKVCVIVK